MSVEESSISDPLYKIGFEACEQYSRTEAILDPPNAQIPSWLRGSLYRTGPGKFEMPLASGEGDYLCEHWFDGFTLLHHYSIESDGIYYRNQYMAEGRARQLAGYPTTSPTTPVVEDGCSSLFKKCLSAFVCCETAEEELPTSASVIPPGADSASVNVTVSRMPDDTMFLKTDAAVLQQFDPATLLPKAIFTYTQYGKELSGMLSAAHEQLDPNTNEYINYVLDSREDGKGIYKLFSLTGQEMTPRVITTIIDDPAYLHSFAMTEHYIIFPVFPYHWDLKALPTARQILDAVRWVKDGSTRYHVVDRSTGKTVVFKAPISFCFHTVNAFEEENGDLIADLCMYTDPSMLNATWVHPPPEHVQPKTFPVPFVQRLKFRDPKRACGWGLNAETLYTSPRSLEMPRINPAYQMKRHRYVYGWNYFGDIGDGAQPMAEQLIKIDLKTKTNRIWKDKRNMFPSEPIFIARPGENTAEDDGVVLSIVLDTTVNPATSFMLILNAATFREIARARLPAALPYTFHGEYFAITQ